MVKQSSKTDTDKNEKVKAPIKLNSEKKFRYRGTVRVPALFTWPDQCVKKYEIIKRILVRWNYCMKWPDDSTTSKDILNERERLRNDKKQMEMPAYPGIFICIHGGDIGTVTDTRDLTKAPTVNNLMKFNCHQLKNLWVTALNEQIKALIASEGDDAVTLLYLKHELRIASDFDASREEINYKKYSHVPFN